MLQTFMTIWRVEGTRTFWSGNLTGCAKIIPFSFIQLAAFERLKLVYGDGCGRLNATTAALSGAGAAIFATAVCYPFDTIKTRLIAQHYGNPKTVIYTGITDALKQIMRNEGIFAFYRGLSITVIGSIPLGSATFATYELLDRLSTGGRCLDGSSNPVISIMSGCLAGSVGHLVAFPWDTIRRKMQAINYSLPSRGGVDVTFHGAVHCCNKILRKYGWRGLWRGCLPYLIKTGPYHGIMFLTYEQAKRAFLYTNGYTSHPFFSQPLENVDQSLKPYEVQEMIEYDIQLNYDEDDEDYEDYL